MEENKEFSEAEDTAEQITESTDTVAENVSDSTDAEISGEEITEESTETNESEEVPEFTAYPTTQAQPAVNYTVTETAKQPMQNGLKVFIAILAVAVALALALGAGYTLGKNGGFGSSSGKRESVEKVIDLNEIPSDAKALSASEIYGIASESVVGIYVYNAVGYYSSGSGIVYSDDGYILTADYLYYGIASPKFKVYTSDGKSYDAKYVAGDARSNVAILKIDAKKKLKPAEFGTYDDVTVGQRAVAVGHYDAANKPYVEEGIISLKSLRVTGTTNYSTKVMNLSGGISKTATGGALYNSYGQVIGMTFSAADSNGVYSNYAIDTKSIKAAAESLVQHGKIVNRAKLGITYTFVSDITAEVSSEYSVKGLYVSEVTNKNLTSLLATGDTITKVNGKDITTSDVILDIIEESLPNDTLSLTVVTKKGTTTEVKAVLLADEGSSSLDTSVPTLLDGEKDDGKNDNNKNNNSSTFSFPFGD